MDKAKAAISDFMSKSGHHDTTVHETVAPAVVHEVVKPKVHEEINTAIDKEIHQDHYHRTVQPIQDREILPEKHSHNVGAVQHKEIDHRDQSRIKQALAAEQQQFRNDRVVTETTHTQSANAAIAGEHVHHHIHETIQPVIKKEVIQPNVVHTIVPIHEVHHHEAQHHKVSELPPVTMSEFKAKGGVLGGREERYDGFQGEPKNIGGMLGGAGVGGAVGAGALGHEHGHRTRSRSSSLSSSDYEGDKSTRQKLRGSKHTGTTGGLTGGAVGGNTSRTGDTATHKKPSLMDKLNPSVDANGDGKAGFMK